MRLPICLAIAAATLVTLLAEVRAAESLIHDRAAFFSSRAKSQADELIARLAKDHHLEVRVETFNSPPAEDAQRVKEMASRERGEYFAGWLKSLAHGEKAHGLFILICREPAHLRMGVSKELHQRGFTDNERDIALKPLLQDFRDREYDRGLIATLEKIREIADRGLKTGAIAANGKLRSQNSSPAGGPLTKPVATPGSGMGGLMCVGLGGLLLVVILFSVARSFFGRMSGGQMAPGYGGGVPGGYRGGYGGGYGGGGGGMLGGMLSGLGGALLGNWVYDQWSGRSAHAGQPDSSPWQSPGGVSQESNYDDFSSGGGDFGSSGGGDFGGGGGDSGGGDSGGGDF